MEVLNLLFCFSKNGSNTDHNTLISVVQSFNLVVQRGIWPRSTYTDVTLLLWYGVASLSSEFDFSRHRTLLIYKGTNVDWRIFTGIVNHGYFLILSYFIAGRSLQQRCVWRWLLQSETQQKMRALSMIKVRQQCYHLQTAGKCVQSHESTAVTNSDKMHHLWRYTKQQEFKFCRHSVTKQQDIYTVAATSVMQNGCRNLPIILMKQSTSTGSFEMTVGVLKLVTHNTLEKAIYVFLFNRTTL
jgi:hypothetical protein